MDISPKKRTHSKVVRSLGNQKKVHLTTLPKGRKQKFPECGLSEHKELDGFLTLENITSKAFSLAKPDGPNDSMP